MPGNEAGGRFLRALAFVASAAVAAAALRFAWFEPLAAAAILALFVALGLGRWLGRRKLRKLLRSGDVDSVLERWSPTLARIPHPATMAPLMTATAFAAYGWVDKARATLATAERGPAWDAALEHRLFLDALLLTFEGDRDAALERASRLDRLPLPTGRGGLHNRVQLLRMAVGALTRAFAHRSHPGDGELLEHAGESSPLVFWAMRYGAAVVAIDQGDLAKVHALLAQAPVWPEQSAFKSFHAEIAERAGLATGE